MSSSNLASLFTDANAENLNAYILLCATLKLAACIDRDSTSISAAGVQ